MCSADTRIAIIAKADPEEADAGGLRLQGLPDHFIEAVRYLASLDPKPCICDKNLWSAGSGLRNCMCLPCMGCTLAMIGRKWNLR